MSRLAEGSGRTRPGAQPWLMSAAIFVAMIGSALSINGAIRSWSWLWFAIVTVGGLLLLLAILRSVKAPPWLVPIAGLAALVVLLTAEFFSDSALLGIIPTGDTFTELSTAVDLMINTIVGGVAPVQDNQGMALLVSAGLGLTTLLVDVLAVSLAMPATAGLGMVAVLVIPALVKVDSVGAFAFVLGAAGYLMILGLSQWYRPDGASGPPTGRQPGQLLRGSVITAGTLAVAMAVATVMPGFDTGAFPQGSYFNPFGVSSGINPLITLGEDLRSPNGQGTIRYATSSAGPIYLRSSTLSNFSGGTWRPDENTSSESTNVGAIKDKTFDATAGNTVVTTTRVQAQAVKSAWLPVPYAPQNITGLKGSWSWDTGTLTVRSQNTSTLNQTYVVRSVMPQLTAAELTNASQPPGRELDQRYLQLPKDTPKIISTTAQQVAGSDTTAYAKAMALQTYLRSSAFTYSFQTPLKEGYDGSGMDVVAKFLEAKSGYCIHFSSAMAVMARELGIPSRIAVGYAPGHVTGNTVSIPGSEMTEYTVDGHDAHAWPELYFEGLGWVPFEPTPGRGQVPAYASNTVNGPAAPANPNDALVPTRSASAAAAASSNAATTSAAPKPEATGDSGNAAAMDLRWLAVTVLALLGLAVLGLPGFLRFSARRRRLRALAGPESARVAWAELHDLCVDYAVPTLPSDTPRTLGNRLAAEISSRSSGPSDCSAQIERIRAAYEQLSYGNRSPGGSTSAVMTAQRSPTAADLQAIQQALADATSPWQRLRITVAPPSTINRVAQWFNARRNRRNAR